MGAAIRVLVADDRLVFSASPNIGVLVLSMHDDDSSVFEAIKAGARGYVVKGARQRALLHAIRTIADGGAVFGPGIARRLIDYFTAAAAATAKGDGSAAGPLASSQDGRVRCSS
jgi:DNA-binding NarL/FixJ family response regulator